MGRNFRDIVQMTSFREEIGARIDLHGMTQERAQAALEAFLHRAWDEGYRAVLVITNFRPVDIGPLTPQSLP